MGHMHATHHFLPGLLLVLALTAGGPLQAADLKVAVFAVAEDEAGVPAKVQAERIFRELLQAGQGFTPIRLGETSGEGARSIAARGMLQAKALLEEAQESFTEQMYDETIEEVAKAVAVLERISGFLDNLDLYLEALAMLGTARVLNGEGELGLEALTRLAAIDSKYPLPQVMHGEKKVHAAYDTARKRVAGASRTHLRVESAPPGAEVFIDGRSRGLAPVTVPQLAEGLHLVAGRLDGYRPAGGPVVVTGGREGTTHRLQLKPAPETRAVQASLGAVLAELDEPRLTPAVTELAERLDAGWLIVGQVRRATTKVVLDFHLYSLRSGDKLRRRRAAVSLADDYLASLRAFAVDFLSGVNEGQPDADILEARNPKPKRQPTRQVRQPAPARPPAARPANRQPTARPSAAGKEEDKKEDKEEGREEDPLKERDGTEDW